MDSAAIPTPITQITPITPIFNKINDIYVKRTYLERYGGSVLFAIFAILVVAFYFVYFRRKFVFIKFLICKIRINHLGRFFFTVFRR